MIRSADQADYWQWKTLLWWPLAWFFCALGLFVVFNIDHGLQHWLYDGSGSFPFQDSDWYELWLHDRIKAASNALVFVVLGAIFWPSKRLGWRSFRLPLIVAVLAMLSCVEVMRDLKDVTGIYCPIQLDEFGGSGRLEPALQIGHLTVLNRGEGTCWPAGHSTAGFAWLAMFFALNEIRRPRAARGMLWAALAYGNFLGLVQLVRGEHFLSHQLYTLMFCWLISLGFFALLRLGNRLFPGGCSP